MQNFSTKPTRLPEELGMYVDELRKRFSSISEVWLLKPKPNAETSRCAWEFLAFASEEALLALRKDRTVHRDDVHFMVVTDGDRFESAWGSPSAGRLSDIAWQPLDIHSATYLDGSTERRAVRVR